MRSQRHSLPPAFVKNLLLMFGLAIASECQAVNLFCASSPGFGAVPGIILSESGAVFVKTVSASCGGFIFGCINPQPLNAVGGKIGATLQLQPGLIVVDVFVSDGALPAGVPEVPATYFSALPPGSANPRGNASFQLSLGSLEAATYVVATRIHPVAVDGSVLNCEGDIGILNVEPASSVEKVAAVEFYNRQKDHYFISANSNEVADLDHGVHPGWVRTGQSFGVYSPLKSGRAGVPVCRYYGLPTAGLDSHFYTANPAECLSMPSKFHGDWIPESINAFEVIAPNAGTGPNQTPATICPAGTLPIFRLWNQRLDSNHRYTTDESIARSMVAQGWFWEGNETADGIVGSPGGPTVSMCSLQ